MKFLKSLLLLCLAQAAYAGVQVQQGDVFTSSGVFLTTGGITFADHSFQSTAGGGSSGGAVSLSTGVFGNLPPTNLNSGSSAGPSTFWRGDGVWAAPISGPGGASNLATYNGTVQVTSPTISVGGDSTTITTYIVGTSSVGFRVNTASVTAQGNFYSIAGIAADTGTINATVVQHTTRLNNLDASTATITTRLVAVGVSTAALAALDSTRVTYSSFSATSPITYNPATGAIGATPVSLSSQVTSNLPVTNLNSGSSATSSTFWRGDGTWATPAGGGSTNGTIVASPQNQVGRYSAPGTTTTVTGSVNLTNDGNTVTINNQSLSADASIITSSGTGHALTIQCNGLSGGSLSSNTSGCLNMSFPNGAFSDGPVLDYSNVTDNQVGIRPVHIILGPNFNDPGGLIEKQGTASNPNLQLRAASQAGIEFIDTSLSQNLTNPAGKYKIVTCGGTDCMTWGARDTVNGAFQHGLDFYREGSTASWSASGDANWVFKSTAAVGWTNYAGTHAWLLRPNDTMTGTFVTTLPAGYGISGQLIGTDGAGHWNFVNASGGGVGSASQLSDFALVTVNSSSQAIGSSCSASAPCQIRNGPIVYSLTAAATAYISGSSASGNVYWYLTAGNVLTVGHNTGATLNCSANCQVSTGITGFPADSVPLWLSSFTSNAWSPIVESMDQRAVYAHNVVSPGSGIASSDDPTTGIKTLTTDSTIVPRYFTGSGAPGINCTTGRDFYTNVVSSTAYFCESTNNWGLFGSGGSTNGSITASPQFQLTYYSQPGTTTTVAGLTGVTTHGNNDLSLSTMTVSSITINTQAQFNNVSSFTFTSASTVTFSGTYFDVSGSTLNVGILSLGGSYGTAGQVPISNGPGLPATWASQSGGSGLTYSSFSAVQPILYNNATGAFSSTLISATTGFTGTLQAAQEPAHTGNMTNTAGSLFTTANGISLSTQVVGNLPVTNLNSGTNADSSHFWRGDGTWISSSSFAGSGASLSSTNTWTGGQTFAAGVTLSSSVNINNGTGNASITENGLTGQIVLSTGNPTVGHVAVFSTSMSVIDGGAAGVGTITGVTAGTGMTGGGTSGTVTLNNSGVLSVSTTATGGTPITGAAQLLPGTNVTLTQSGQGITIAASGASGASLSSTNTWTAAQIHVASVTFSSSTVFNTVKNTLLATDINGVLISTTVSGGTSVPAISSTSFMPWGYWAYVPGGGSITATANRGHTQAFTVPYPGITFTNINIYINTGSGTSCTGGTCGFVMTVHDIQAVNAVCVSTVGTSGNSTANFNINTTGLHSLTMASGSNVSAGVCTLSAGTYIMTYDSDSTALQIADSGDSGQGGARQVGANFPIRWGDAGGATSTGDGFALAPIADIHAVSFAGTSNAFPVVLER